MILKTIKLKSAYFDELENADDSEVENFESMVDLFTLLSFALIISTLLFGYQYIHETDDSVIKVTNFETIYEGNAPPLDLPEDTIILFITVDNKQDILYLKKGNSPREIIYQTGQSESLWRSLEDKKRLFLNSNDIQIVVINKNKTVNAELYLEIDNWMAAYSFKTTVIFSKVIGERQL